MQSDRLVSARDVLRAIQEVRRRGIERLLAEWEQREPDLAEHLLEGISDLHRRIAAIAPHPKAERQLIRRTESLVLVLLTAFRRAALAQWQGEESHCLNDPPAEQPHPDTDKVGEKGEDAPAD